MPITYTLNSPRVYRLNDLPGQPDPLQQIKERGIQSLSLQEILGVAAGNPEHIISHVQEYGMHSLTALHTLEETMQSLHLSELEAGRLLAAIELGKRLYSKSHTSLLQIKSIEDVFTHFRSMTLLPKEQLRALCINSRSQLVHEEVLAVGSIESLHISARDVFQAAVERRVTALILVHNHPSGDPTPSPADYDFTRNIKMAATILGIQLIDHVIIAEGGYASSMPD